MAKNYFELNTNLDINQTAVVPALNGRQGDNNREVGFFIKDGKFPMDLSNKTIKLFAKDAAGVVKETESINDRTGITAGRFTLLVQKEFYQAIGQVEDSFIEISDKGTGQIVSTIPVSFAIFENKMVITQTQSQVYLDTVQKTIDDFSQRIKTVGTNLETIENAQKHLESMIDTINTEFNSDAFAKRQQDNRFTANNSFNMPIIATGGVVGNADTATKADNAEHAVKADIATNAMVARSLDSTVDQKVGNLISTGLINGKQKIIKREGEKTFYNVHFTLIRIGSLVTVTIWSDGYVGGGMVGNSTLFNGIDGIPAGFRPIIHSNGSFHADTQTSELMAWPDGGLSFNNTVINQTNGYYNVFGNVTYVTADDMPE